MLEKFKFKSVDSKVIDHPVEQRGFVTVPFDYRNRTSETIEIFYRLIPAKGSDIHDRTKPFLVVINGGPGISCSHYRPLDFDYQNPNAPQNGILDRFRFLSQSYRVIIVDQRGTDGQSAPLEMKDENLDYHLIAEYFSSDFQARDYLAVIQKLIPEEEPFFMIAQSYGGMVGMQYLSLNQRTPKGIVFSSSALPYEDPLPAMVSRRKEQFELNLQLKKFEPQIEAKLDQVRKHFLKLNLDPVQVNGLYSWLGKGKTGVWENNFIIYLDQILKMDRSTLDLEMKKNIDDVNLLNYILSSPNFTPGFTDRTLAEKTAKIIPYEPWMLEEDAMIAQAGRMQWVLEMDKNPPKPTPFASIEDLRESIKNNQLLFTVADNDAYVPAESYLRAVAKFQVPGHTEVKTIPGGHSAIFLEEGYKVFKDWTLKL